jgi:hypothetical protein
MRYSTLIGAWFAANWMYGGIVAGLFLFAMVPLVADVLPLPVVLVYLQLPIYMLHQVEEHAGDRFRRFVNDHIAGGRNALTTPAVIVINVGLVWGVDLFVLYLTRFVAPGLGLIAVYLTLVNAVVHIAGAIAGRAYNPGLATAIVLFIPFGAWALFAVAEMPGVSVADHIIGLGLALAVHVAIIGYVLHRRAAVMRPRRAAHSRRRSGW